MKVYNDKSYESLLCFDLNCKDKPQVQELSGINFDINIELALSDLPKHNKRLNDVIIIGWNDRIKLLHGDVINAFLFWYDQGKPGDGNIPETMKETRK